MALRVLSGGAVRAGLGPAAALYRQRTGVALAIEYQPMGPLRRRLSADSLPDLLILAADAMTEAERRGLVARGPKMEIGRVAVGVAVPAASPPPDISTPEALRAALLAAPSIVYIDPREGTSGRHVAAVLAQLGIAEAVGGKTVFGREGAVVEPVGRGAVALGIHQMTAMSEVPGVRIVGPLPPPLAKETAYVGAASITTGQGPAVTAFLAFLRTPEIRALFARHGFIGET